MRALVAAIALVLCAGCATLGPKSDRIPFARVDDLPTFSLSADACPDGTTLWAHGQFEANGTTYAFGVALVDQHFDRFILIEFGTERTWRGQTLADRTFLVTGAAALPALAKEFPHPCDFLARVKGTPA